jgi:hypothetical protein
MSVAIWIKIKYLSRKGEKSQKSESVLVSRYSCVDDKKYVIFKIIPLKIHQ